MSVTDRSQPFLRYCGRHTMAVAVVAVVEMFVVVVVGIDVAVCRSFVVVTLASEK